MISGEMRGSTTHAILSSGVRFTWHRYDVSPPRHCCRGGSPIEALWRGCECGSESCVWYWWIAGILTRSDSDQSVDVTPNCTEAKARIGWMLAN